MGKCLEEIKENICLYAKIFLGWFMCININTWSINPEGKSHTQVSLISKDVGQRGKGTYYIGPIIFNINTSCITLENKMQ